MNNCNGRNFFKCENCTSFELKMAFSFQMEEAPEEVSSYFGSSEPPEATPSTSTNATGNGIVCEEESDDCSQTRDEDDQDRKPSLIRPIDSKVVHQICSGQVKKVKRQWMRVLIKLTGSMSHILSIGDSDIGHCGKRAGGERP